MDHRNLYKASISGNITQKINKRRSLAQKERSEKRRELFKESRNIQSNQNEQKSESNRSNIKYKKADFMIRFLAWKEEKLKRLENEKKTRVKPFVSAAFKSSFVSNNHSFVRLKRQVNKDSISKHTITQTKSKLKVDQKTVVKHVQSNNKYRNSKSLEANKKANDNAIVKPKLITPSTVETAISYRKNKVSCQSENKNSKLDGNDVKFCNSEPKKRINHVNNNYIKCAGTAVTKSKDKALECDETKKKLKKKDTKPIRDSIKKSKLKAKSENLAVTRACDHLPITPMESNQLNFDIFIKATSTQVKSKSSLEYPNILDFSISPLTVETTMSSPKNKETVKSTKKTSKLGEDDVIKFCNTEPNKCITHVNGKCIKKSVKKETNKNGMFVTISKDNLHECDEMKKEQTKKIIKFKKNTNENPSSIVNNVLREAHEAYVRNRQKSAPSKNNIALSSITRQLTPSLTPNKRLLKRKSQVLSSKFSIKSKKKLKPELLGVLNTPPMSADTFNNYQHNLIKSVLRTPRIAEQQEKHKYVSTPIAVFNKMDITQGSDEQRSLHLRKRRVLYRPDSEIIIP